MNPFMKRLLFCFGTIFFGVLASRLLLNVALDPSMVFAFLVISLFLGLIPAISSHLKKNLFTLIYLLGIFIGLVNMAYISLNRSADGWSDLVSIFGLLTFALIGFGAGVLLEGSVFLVRRYKK